MLPLVLLTPVSGLPQSRMHHLLIQVFITCGLTRTSHLIPVTASSTDCLTLPLVTQLNLPVHGLHLPHCMRLLISWQSPGQSPLSRATRKVKHHESEILVLAGRYSYRSYRCSAASQDPWRVQPACRLGISGGNRLITG